MHPVEKALPTPLLLAVLAHPDDESFGMGGTLALYAQLGAAVHLVCATRGESGQVAPQYLQGFASVAERRVYELSCAAEILGLAGVHFLDYRDSGMPGSPDNRHPQALAVAPIEQVAGKIAVHIRRLRPQVLVTFDPIGGYRHPDHVAVHQATLRAFELARDPDFEDGLPAHQVQKMYFHVMPRGRLRFWMGVMRLTGRDPRKFGRNGDIDLVSLVDEGDFPTHASIDISPVRERKDAAAACHASQLDGGMPRRGLLSCILRWYTRRERFMRAYPPAEGGKLERDLFAGIALDWSRNSTVHKNG